MYDCVGQRINIGNNVGDFLQLRPNVVLGDCNLEAERSHAFPQPRQIHGLNRRNLSKLCDQAVDKMANIRYISRDTASII